MCSRFALKSPPQAIAQLFGLEKMADWKPRYNIAPSQKVPVVIRTLEHKEREIRAIQWGLLASWTQGGRRIVNYRSEEINGKPVLRESFEKWRCLVPADGFYEWQHAARETRPYYFQMKNKKPLAFAGLWTSQETKEGAVEAFSLLTTTPNEVVRPIHDRMPVIIGEKDYSRWLDKDAEDFEDLKDLFKPFPADRMESFSVNTWVNNTRHDDPRCMEHFQGPETLELAF